MPMAHLDIAGADMTADEKATGTSVKTIVQYLLNENGNSKTVVVSKAKPAVGKTKSAAKTAGKSKVAAKTRKK
jgi:hypothetical protein